MSEIKNYQSGSANEQQRGPDGLLFTGDYIQALSPDQIAAIGDFASRLFGVEMRRVRSVTQELDDDVPLGVEAEPEPVPVRRKDFVNFAVENGYPKMRAWKSWGAVVRMGERQPKYFEGDTLPSIKLLAAPGIGAGSEFTRMEDQVVDLASIFRRLERSSLDANVWDASEDQVKFLAHLCIKSLPPGATAELRMND